MKNDDNLDSKEALKELRLSNATFLYKLSKYKNVARKIVKNQLVLAEKYYKNQTTKNTFNYSQ